MKKLLCILLSVVLVIGTSVFAVNAAENPKIENDLAEEINEGSQEIISVYIWLKQIASESEIESIVAEKYTWANEQEHLKYYRTELRNIVAPYVQQFVDENAELIENIRFQGKNVEFIIADVKKENITTLAESDLVTGLSLYEELVEPVAEDTEKLFQDAFVDWSVNEFGEECLAYGYSYDELFIHYNDQEPDWVLVNARFSLPEPDLETWINIGGICGRTIYGPSIGSPFLTGYGIYDVKENKFYGLEELSEDKYDDTIYIDEPIYDYSKYDGLIAVLTELDIGYKRGDANIDTNVDILDATEIQKVSVDKVEFSKDQVQIADVNDDEKADILDATAIQKALVAQ